MLNGSYFLLFYVLFHWLDFIGAVILDFFQPL